MRVHVVDMYVLRMQHTTELARHRFVSLYVCADVYIHEGRAAAASACACAGAKRMRDKYGGEDSNQHAAPPPGSRRGLRTCNAHNSEGNT